MGKLRENFFLPQKVLISDSGKIIIYWLQSPFDEKYCPQRYHIHQRLSLPPLRDEASLPSLLTFLLGKDLSPALRQGWGHLSARPHRVRKDSRRVQRIQLGREGGRKGTEKERLIWRHTCLSQWMSGVSAADGQAAKNSSPKSIGK